MWVYHPVEPPTPVNGKQVLGPKVAEVLSLWGSLEDPRFPPTT